MIKYYGYRARLYEIITITVHDIRTKNCGYGAMDMPLGLIIKGTYRQRYMKIRLNTTGTGQCYIKL